MRKFFFSCKNGILMDCKYSRPGTKWILLHLNSARNLFRTIFTRKKGDDTISWLCNSHFFDVSNAIKKLFFCCTQGLASIKIKTGEGLLREKKSHPISPTLLSEKWELKFRETHFEGRNVISRVQTWLLWQSAGGEVCEAVVVAIQCWCVCLPGGIHSSDMIRNYVFYIKIRNNVPRP